jgi:hypothetical protein
MECRLGHEANKYPAFSPDVLCVAFSIPAGSLSLVKYPVYVSYHFVICMNLRINKQNKLLQTGISHISITNYCLFALYNVIEWTEWNLEIKIYLLNCNENFCKLDNIIVDAINYSFPLKFSRISQRTRKGQNISPQ